MIIITQINYLIISYNTPYSQMYIMDNLQIWLKPAKTHVYSLPWDSQGSLFWFYIYDKEIKTTEIKQFNIYYWN